MVRVRFVERALPDLAIPPAVPVLPPSIFLRRYSRVERARVAVVNMEDGFVLADGDLREQLCRLDTDLMGRCQARRELMETLGYDIAPEILPLSSIAGAFFPFLLAPRYVAEVT